MSYHVKTKHNSTQKCVLCVEPQYGVCPSNCRVWDALFNEGSKILYRVALALLKQHEALLLSKDNAGGLGGWGG